MRQAYIGIAILLVVGLLNAGLFLALSHLASVRRPTRVKASAYESGIDPLGDTRDLGLPGLIAMSVFVLVLGVGLAYEWKKGALEWE